MVILNSALEFCLVFGSILETLFTGIKFRTAEDLINDYRVVISF